MHLFCMKEALGVGASASFQALHLNQQDVSSTTAPPMKTVTLPVANLDLNIGDEAKKPEEKQPGLPGATKTGAAAATSRTTLQPQKPPGIARSASAQTGHGITFRRRGLKATTRAKDRHLPSEVVSLVAPVFSHRMLALEPEPKEGTWEGQLPDATFLHTTQKLTRGTSSALFSTGGVAPPRDELGAKQSRVVDRESRSRLDAVRALLQRSRSRASTAHAANAVSSPSPAGQGSKAKEGQEQDATVADEGDDYSTRVTTPTVGASQPDKKRKSQSDTHAGKVAASVKQTQAFYSLLEFIEKTKKRRDLVQSGVAIEEDEEMAELHRRHETLMAEFTHLQDAASPDTEATQQAELLQQLGETSLHLGRPDAALGFLQSAASSNPRSAAVHWLLFITYAVVGNSHAALEAVDQCIRLQPEYRFYRARAHLLRDVPDAEADTISALQMAIIYNGQDADAYFLKAQLEERHGDTQQAASDLLMVLEIDPDHLMARRKYAEVLFARGSYRQSIKHLTALIVAMPYDPHLYFQRSLANSHSEEHTAALLDITQCIHLDPNNKRAYFNRALMLSKSHPYRAIKDLSIALLIDAEHELSTEAYLRRGMLYAKLKHPKEALPDLLACLANEELKCLKQGKPSQTLVSALCQLGLLNLRQLGKYATAIKHFTKALGADPSCEDAMLARAECYLELDKQSRAFETDYSDQTLYRALHDYARLVHISPTNIKYRMLCGRLALRLNLARQAEAMLSGARRLCEHLGESPSLQTDVDIFLGHRDEAIAVLCRTIWPSSASTTTIKNVTQHLKDNLVEGTVVASYFPALGRALLQSGRLQEAVSIFQHMIDVGAETADVYYNLGLCCLRLGDDKLALNLFNQAVSTDNTHPLALFERAKCKLKLGLPRVLPDVNRALEKDPSLWQAYLTRAAYYAGQRRFPKAIMDCNKALEIEPSSTRALIMRGCLKLLNKTLELGVRDLTEAAEKDPNNPLPFFNRGVGFHMLGMYDHAVSDYSIVLLYTKGEVYREQVLLNRSLAYMSMDQNISALSDLLELLQRSPENATNPTLLHTTALCFYRNRDYMNAIEYYSRAIDLNHHFVQAYLGRGNALLDMNTGRSRVLAKRDFMRAIHIDPRFTPAYHNLAICLQTSGQLRQAYVVLSHAISWAPHNTVLLEARAVVALQVQQLNDAFRDLSHALTMHPTAKLYNARGVVLLYSKQGRSAVADFRAAIAADATYVLAYYNLANIFLAKRQLRQALSLYDKACELSGEEEDDEDLFNNRGICKAKLGDKEAALADFQRAAAPPHCNIDVLFNLALIQYELSHMDEAAKALAAYFDRTNDVDTMARRLQALIRASQHADSQA